MPRNLKINDALIDIEQRQPRKRYKPSPRLVAIKEAIHNQLVQQDRSPWAEIAAEIIAGKPSITDWRAFAAAWPDRWARAAREIGALAGFSDRQLVKHNVAVTIFQRSDAEVMQRMAELVKQLQLTNSGPATPAGLIELMAEPAQEHEQPLDNVSDARVSGSK